MELEATDRSPAGPTILDIISSAEGNTGLVITSVGSCIRMVDEIRSGDKARVISAPPPRGGVAGPTILAVTSPTEGNAGLAITSAGSCVRMGDEIRSGDGARVISTPPPRGGVRAIKFGVGAWFGPAG